MLLPLTVNLPPTPTASTSSFVVDPSSRQPLLIELQGTLETGTVGTAASKAGASIGQLDLSQPARPQLRIGHHLLTGKLVKLEKPLAVLKHVFHEAGLETEEALLSPEKDSKRLRSDYTSSPDAFRNFDRFVPPKTPEALLSNASSSPLTALPPTPAGVVELRKGSHEIIGVIRTKLVFSARPTPIVDTTGLS